MKQIRSLAALTQTAMVAALYAVLTFVLPVASFGTLQCRFSEALTALPVVSRRAIAGLTLGCAIANAIGVAMGANIAGIWDILVGSAATLLAAWLSFLCRRIRIKGIPWLSLLWPVAVNAVIIGAELTLVTLGSWQWSGWCLFAAQVALGELIPSVAGGILLVKALENTRWGSSIFGE